VDAARALGACLMRQLVLAVRLPDSAVFDAFHPGPNGEAVEYLRHVTARGTPGAWLWGPAAVGKTHLLQAACGSVVGAAYLPADELAARGPAALEGWEDRPLVCLDDLQRLAGDPAWELALFSLVNGLGEHGGKWLAAAAASPSASGIRLPDLVSRLSWGTAFRLEPLDEEERIAALRLRARHRGLELPPETARYLMRRLPRDMRALCDWLDRLDVASLAAQKRLTVPFVRDVIAGAEEGPGA
jgi:DnaA family protein